MKYDVPINSPEHAEFCKREAERRYDGKIINDRSGFFLVEDRHGFTHTDDVLRAVSVYEMSDDRLDG